jgi:diguanylate cyclase (GGDEF)-like protein
MRKRIPGGDRAALLDAAILASGVGVLVWSLGFAPLVIVARQEPVIPFALFYPTLIALAVVARLWFVGGADRPATRLVILFLLASNVVTGIDALRDLVGQTVLGGAHVLAVFVTLAFVGAAALHPSMAFAAERQQPDIGRISRRRLAALTVALLVNPATLALQVSSGRQLDAAPYLISGIVIGLLVVIRLGDALRRLGETLSERDELMKRLRNQALFDALTALPNRTLFDERLAAAMAERTNAAMLAVLMIDIDDFKGVNDRSGHAAGDAVLVAVGSRLRGAIRAGDTAARFGGDEFVVALPACADAGIPIRVAERILAAMDLPLQIGASVEQIRVSIGIVVAAVDDRTTDDLVRKADVAMYRSKTAGKGRITLFEPGMQATSVARLRPPNVLRPATLGGVTA